MLGYEKEVDWVQVCIEVPKEIPSKYARVTKLSKEMFGLRVKKLTNADVVKHGYGRKVFKLLNTAYAPPLRLYRIIRQTSGYVCQTILPADRQANAARHTK